MRRSNVPRSCHTGSAQAGPGGEWRSLASRARRSALHRSASRSNPNRLCKAVLELTPIRPQRTRTTSPNPLLSACRFRGRAATSPSVQAPTDQKAGARCTWSGPTGREPRPRVVEMHGMTRGTERRISMGNLALAGGGRVARSAGREQMRRCRSSS
jgi:hypothetical protein